ncbi:hypothetical protein V6Z12_D13G115300 [Gossypium hirsutum]
MGVYRSCSGTLSVDEYKVKFVQLSQYAPKLVSFKANHCKRFRFGLNCEIKLYQAAQNTKVFDELVEKASALEETLGEEPKVASFGVVKRSIKAASGSGRKGKRGHFSIFGRRIVGGRGQDRQAARVEASPVDQGAVAWRICEHYSRRHYGECWRMMGACLVYGSMEHHVSDYSRRAIVDRD